MPNHHPSYRWSLSLAVLGLVTLTAPAESQETKGILAGSWKFNPAKTAEEKKDAGTDRPAFDREDRARKSSPAAQGAATAGVPATGGPNLGPLVLYARPLPMLTIVQTDSTISISDPRGTPRTYQLDGRKGSEPLLGGESLEIVAKWKDGKLTTERKLGSHGTIREVYTIRSTGELFVEVRLTAPQLTPPLQLRWIYDAAPGS